MNDLGIEIKVTDPDKAEQLHQRLITALGEKWPDIGDLLNELWPKICEAKFIKSRELKNLVEMFDAIIRNLKVIKGDIRLLSKQDGELEERFNEIDEWRDLHFDKTHKDIDEKIIALHELLLTYHGNMATWWGRIESLENQTDNLDCRDWIEKLEKRIDKADSHLAVHEDQLEIIEYRIGLIKDFLERYEWPSKVIPELLYVWEPNRNEDSDQTTEG